MAVLLVEHDVGLVMSTCDRIIVLDFGRVIASGTPAEVRENPAVQGGVPGDAEEDARGAFRGRRAGGATMSATLIECRGLSAGYGQLAVIHDLDLQVNSGEVVALIGRNGAGKTSTLLSLAGELKPMAGEVRWMDEPTTAPMHVRCRAGLGYLTEERSVIMNLTAADNLRLADVSPEKACELFPALQPVMKRTAGLLSGGEQQMLALARALCREPKVLLADELSLGLAPLIVTRLLATLRAGGARARRRDPARRAARPAGARHRRPRLRHGPRHHHPVGPGHRDARSARRDRSHLPLTTLTPCGPSSAPGPFGGALVEVGLPGFG